MKKRLSICLPSYNMEIYLERCMKSLLIPEIVDKLELIIVNDGSKDRTLEISNAYKSHFPDSIIVIDKPNGHYGSCINAALKVATGKYFRILDPDDWFESNNFRNLVYALEDRNEEAIFTRFTLQNERLGKVIEQNDTGIVYDKTLDLDEYIIPKSCLAMHNFTYRLDFLKKINYKQTEGICYTDTEYVYFPLCTAKTLYCFDFSLYQYYIGRNEQSMSVKSIINNYAHFEKVLNSLWNSKLPATNANTQSIRLHYDVLLLSYMLQINIVYGKEDMSRSLDLRQKLDLLKSKNQEAYTQLLESKYHGIQYIKCWKKGGIANSLILLALRKAFQFKHKS